MISKTGGLAVKVFAAIIAVGIVGGGAAWFISNQSGVNEDYVPGDSVMRRLTAEQYTNVVSDVFGKDIKLGGRFEPDLRVEGLYAVGASHVSVTGAGMEQYDAMARTIASQVVDESHRRLTIPCEPKDPSAADDACVRKFFERTGALLYRRPITDTQLDTYVTAARDATGMVGDFYEGLSLSLSAMLSAPEFIFRQQVVEPDPSHKGDYRLDAYSKASELSFFLWNSTPDAQLLEAAESGALHKPKGLKAQVDRMIASPRLKAGTRAFFIDNFRFDDFANLTKDTELFPKYNAEVAAAAQEQTLKTVVDLLLNKKEDYRKLFTTRDTFLTPQLGSIYQVPVVQAGPNGAPEAWQPYEFSDTDPRAGILTHLSFTGLHSPAGRGSPTLRGMAVREVMLCQHVPAPPANVNFTLVEDIGNQIHKTARERLAAHATVPSCAGCHKLMDPLGFALENFDGAGAFRTHENGAPIDTHGELDTVPFKDAAGLGVAVSNNPSTTSCLVERLVSYARGRTSDRGEKSWLDEMTESFADSNYRLPNLMQQIASSEEFYRVSAPAKSVADNNSHGISFALAEKE